MVWHTCEGVSSIDQWIWDKRIKEFLHCSMVSRLAFRREIERTFLGDSTIRPFVVKRLTKRQNVIYLLSGIEMAIISGLLQTSGI